MVCSNKVAFCWSFCCTTQLELAPDMVSPQPMNVGGCLSSELGGELDLEEPQKEGAASAIILSMLWASLAARDIP